MSNNPSPNRATDFTAQQRAELEAELLRELVHDHDAMRFITAAFDDVRASYPHLPPRDVLQASRGAWHAVEYGWMSARSARRAIPGQALLEATRNSRTAPLPGS